MLRPAFTQSIANDLKKHKSINVFGKEGQGLNKLVEDLVPHIPENTVWVRISMRSYADSYRGFIKDLARQLKIDVDKSNETITFLINRYLKENEKDIWLCLEHFDRLALINTDKLYDRDFLDYLNSLRNDSNISILLTTEKKLATRGLYLGGGHKKGSLLEVDHQQLPDLKSKEIENYLYTALDGRPKILRYLKKEKERVNVLIGEIKENSDPFEYLRYLCTNLSDGGNFSDFNDQIGDLKNKFTKNQTNSIANKISNLEKSMDEAKDHTRRISEFTKGLLWLKTQWKAILLLLLLLTAFLWKPLLSYGQPLVKNLWAFLQSFFK